MSLLSGAWLLALLAAIPIGWLLVERLHMRRALVEQQRTLEGVFSGAANGMAILDLSGRLQRVNQALCEMTGYPEPELLKRFLPEITYPDDRFEAEALFRRLVAGEIPSYQLQKRYVHRSGHLFWASVSNTLVRDEKGRPRYCVAQMQEISEYRRELDALAQRERRFAKAQELAGLTGWEWDLRTDTITWADPVYQTFGANPETFEPCFKTYLELVVPDDRELIETSLSKAMADHLPFSLDQRITRPDGEQRIVHVKAEVRVGPDGQAEMLYGSAQDVTETRQALDAVFRQAEEHREVSEVLRRRNAEIEREIAERDQELLSRDLMFRRIVQDVPAAIAYFDAQFACQWMSPEAQVRFGIPAEEVSRLSAKDVPLFGLSASRFASVMASGEPHRETGVPLLLRDGSVERQTYWDYSLIPCRDADGEPEGLLAFAREVTDRHEKVQLQERQIKALEASEALKDRFLSSLSHEIRSPLTVILGAAMLFQGESLGPLTEKQNVYVAKLLRNGRELLRLVNNVLEANVLRSGRFALIPEALSMEAIVREVLAEFRASAALKGQTLIDELEGHLPRVMVDRRRLTQVWLNLVANAVQYAPDGAPIALRLRREGRQLRGEVFNAGSQISAERLEGVFSAWLHLESAKKGLGLGLGLCKALIEAHGGRFGVQSQPEGVTAWFTLPLGSPQDAG